VKGDGEFPRTERYEAPLYLARYLERQARQGNGGNGEAADDSVPLYLRRFREKHTGRAPAPAEQAFNAKAAEVARSKEIVAPPEARVPLRAQVRLVRHGETQGYSVDSGLTPLGSWQSHRRGFDLSKGVKDGDVVRLVCAGTPRARQTAEHMHRGLLDGLEQWGRRAEVIGPEILPELINFRVSTPSGLKDVTAAFREYQSVMEGYERVALGDRPLWLVEIDRFWRTQVAGADPIHHWLTIPMLHFEPPISCVRRFWTAITRLVDEAPPHALRIYAGKACGEHTLPQEQINALLVEHARAEHPGLPLVLLGHSMGSFAVKVYLLDHARRVAGAALTGTVALDLAEAGNASAWKLADKAAAPAVVRRTPFDWLSRDEAEVDAYIADPLCGFRLNVKSRQSMYAAYARTTQPEALRVIPSRLPLLFFVGEEDAMHRRLAYFHPLVERFRAAGVEDITVHIYEGARHEVLHETNRAAVVGDVVRWVGRVVGG